MRKNNKYFMFFAAGIILGGIVGILSLNILVSYRIDQYYKEIRSLQSVIADKDIRLDKLEKALHSKKLVIKDVKVVLIFEEDQMEDDITKIALEKHIKEKYKELLGKEVEKMDVDILWEVIDKRIMKIDDVEYNLSLKKLMVTQYLKLWIEVKV